MNPNDQTLCLIKVTSSQEYADKLLQGDLFARRLSGFRKLEGDSQRGDSFEASIVYPHDQSKFVFETKDPVTGKKEVLVIPPEDLAANPRLRLQALDSVNVFCTYAVDADNLRPVPDSDTKARLELPSDLWKLGSYAVVIFDVHKFIERVRIAAYSQNYKTWAGRVVYYDPADSSPPLSHDIQVAFTKRNQYAHQKEFRLAIDTNTIGSEPLTLSIGDISDIALTVTRNNLDDKLSISVIKTPPGQP